MEKPVSLKPEHIRDEKVKVETEIAYLSIKIYLFYNPKLKSILALQIQVLQSVSPIALEDVVLGQYEGYKEDPTVSPDSNTPTFASVILKIHNERWDGMMGNSTYP